MILRKSRMPARHDRPGTPVNRPTDRPVGHRDDRRLILVAAAERDQWGPTASVPQGPPPVAGSRETGAPDMVSVGYQVEILSADRPT